MRDEVLNYLINGIAVWVSYETYTKLQKVMEMDISYKDIDPKGNVLLDLNINLLDEDNKFKLWTKISNVVFDYITNLVFEKSEMVSREEIVVGNEDIIAYYNNESGRPDFFVSEKVYGILKDKLDAFNVTIVVDDDDVDNIIYAVYLNSLNNRDLYLMGSKFTNTVLTFSQFCDNTLIPKDNDIREIYISDYAEYIISLIYDYIWRYVD